MTDEELREIEERAKAASKGPWIPWGGEGWPKGWEHFSGSKDHTGIGWPVRDDMNMLVCVVEEDRTADQQFIAHSRQDIPRLIEEIRRLREENEELKSSHYNLTGKKWDEEQEQWKKEKERAIKQSREAHQMLKPKP